MSVPPAYRAGTLLVIGVTIGLLVGAILGFIPAGAAIGIISGALLDTFWQKGSPLS